MFVIPCPITSIVETETSPQGIGYAWALDNGFLPQMDQTPRRITTSHAKPITRERPRGSLKAASLKTGCQEVPLPGFMENVCPPSLLFVAQLLMFRDLHSRLGEEHPLVCHFPDIVAKFENSC
jgi:hypothetical protein